MGLVAGGHVGHPVLPRPSEDLPPGLVLVPLQQVAEPAVTPVRVGAGEELHQRVRACRPVAARGGDRERVAAPGRRNYRVGQENMAFEQVRSGAARPGPGSMASARPRRRRRSRATRLFTRLESGSPASELTMYTRVQLAWASHASRIAMRSCTSDAVIIGPCARPRPATATIPRATISNFLTGFRTIHHFLLFRAVACPAVVRRALPRHSHVCCSSCARSQATDCRPRDRPFRALLTRSGTSIEATQESTLNEKSIVIVGAGMAGLSAGCYARMNGYKATILEMHSIPGGLCTAWTRKGYTFDISMHMLTGSKSGPLHEMWQELGVMENRQFHYHNEMCTIESGTRRLVHLHRPAAARRADARAVAGRRGALAGVRPAGLRPEHDGCGKPEAGGAHRAVRQSSG